MDEHLLQTYLDNTYLKDATKIKNNSSRNVVLFIQELRKLFALMLRSNRKEINPSKALKLLRNCSKYDVEAYSQEDVSEFSTILVDLIEEGFDILNKVITNKTENCSSEASILTGESSSNSKILIHSEPNKLINENNNNYKSKDNPIFSLLSGRIKTLRKCSGRHFILILNVQIVLKQSQTKHLCEITFLNGVKSTKA
jgi:hypothetical protein